MIVEFGNYELLTVILRPSMWAEKAQETSEHSFLRTAARKQFQLFPSLIYTADQPSGLPQRVVSTKPPGFTGNPCTECLHQVAKVTFHLTSPLRKGVPTLRFTREFLYTRCTLTPLAVSWYMRHSFHFIHGKSCVNLIPTVVVGLLGQSSLVI